MIRSGRIESRPRIGDLDLRWSESCFVIVDPQESFECKIRMDLDPSHAWNAAASDMKSKKPKHMINPPVLTVATATTFMIGWNISTASHKSQKQTDGLV